MRRILVYLFFLLSGSLAAADPPSYFFRHLGGQQGLSEEQVTCLLQDDAGFLWVGTANGLNRYDGYQFRVFLPESRSPSLSISNEYISDLLQDAQGYIWIATHNGLDRYDPRTERFRHFYNSGSRDSSLPNSLVRDLYLDAQQRLWVICDNRDPARFDPASGRFITYPWKQALARQIPAAAGDSYQAIYKLSSRSATELWLDTKFGLWSLDIPSGRFRHHPLPAKAAKSPTRPIAAGSYLYSPPGPAARLLEYQQEQWYPIDLPAGLSDSVKAIQGSFLYRGQYWLLSDKGLLTLDPRTRRIQQIRPGIANNHSAPTGALQAYTVDDQGTLWVGGAGGLWMYSPAFQHFQYKPLPAAASSDFFRLVDSTFDGCLYALDQQRSAVSIFKGDQLLHSLRLPAKASFLFLDRRGQVWTAAGRSLFRIDSKAGTLIPFPITAEVLAGAGDIAFSDMAEDSQGNLWLGNDYNGLLIYLRQQNAWIHPGAKEDFISTNVSTLLADPQRRTIWIGTEDYGLYRYDEAAKRFTLYRPAEDNPRHSLGAYMVRALCRDSSGHIWIATDPGGVSRFDYAADSSEAFTTLGMEDGLPANQVFSLLCDAESDLWAASSKGLACIDHKSLRIRAWARREGSLLEYWDRPLQWSRQGQVISGLGAGYQSFRPGSLKSAYHSSRLILTSFRIFDREYFNPGGIRFQQAIRLQHRDNFFSFDIASGDFANTGRYTYAYRLLGYDQPWTELRGKHSASYTQVPPGEYILEVRAARDGLWEPPGIRLPITILPPFWATWWFRLLVLLLLASAAWLWYRAHIARIRRTEALKTAFQQRIAETEMAALRAQMNPHFVFNCLSSINHFILSHRSDEASAYLTKFSRLIRLILDNSRSERIELRRELDSLQLYIELEQMRFEDRFEYICSIDPALNPETIEIPSMLIQPYVENAIWHGLLHKKEKGLLSLRIAAGTSPDAWTIVIEDNGIGRAQAKALKSRSAARQKSHGLELNAERLGLLNQLYRLRASVAVEDLYDAAGLPAGTRVTLQIQAA